LSPERSRKQAWKPLGHEGDLREEPALAPPPRAERKKRVSRPKR
jgi:hypothetical protein